MKYRGFDPCFDTNSHMLILGSFPSVKSREAAFYYGHPRNRFWGLLAEAFDAPIPKTVAEKRALALANGIALWDIVDECSIEGSMDANIRDFTVVDIYRVLDAAPIRRILLNGKTAAKIFRSRYPSLSDMTQSLPSTSPANPRFDRALWLAALRGE